jgi:hypothetical protein
MGKIAGHAGLLPESQAVILAQCVGQGNHCVCSKAIQLACAQENLPWPVVIIYNA